MTRWRSCLHGTPQVHSRLRPDMRWSQSMTDILRLLTIPFLRTVRAQGCRGLAGSGSRRGSDSMLEQLIA